MHFLENERRFLEFIDIIKLTKRKKIKIQTNESSI